MLFEESWFTLHECAPGAELFRSEQRFRLIAQEGTPPRTLFRAVEVDGDPPWTLTDLLFDETTFVRVHRVYDGLVVRMPTAAEAASILGGMPPLEDWDSERGWEGWLQPVVLESEGKTDYVVAGSFLWCHGVGTMLSPSRLAEPYDPDGQPWRRVPSSEIRGGLGVSATVADVRAALEGPEMPGVRLLRERYRYVYAVMQWSAFTPQSEHPHAVFLTREEADAEAARRSGSHLRGGGPSKDSVRWRVAEVRIAV